MACNVLLVGHGKLPSALADTVEFIYGSKEGIQAVDMPEPFDQDKYETTIKETIKNNDFTLFLCDLLGGSPFLTCSRIMKDHMEKAELLTGVNLGMLLELMPVLENCELNELKEKAIHAGRDGIIDIKERLGI